MALPIPAGSRGTIHCTCRCLSGGGWRTSKQSADCREPHVQENSPTHSPKIRPTVFFKIFLFFVVNVFATNFSKTGRIGHPKFNRKAWGTRLFGAEGSNRSGSFTWAGEQEKLRSMQLCFFLTSSFVEL